MRPVKAATWRWGCTFSRNSTHRKGEQRVLALLGQSHRPYVAKIRFPDSFSFVCWLCIAEMECGLGILKEPLKHTHKEEPHRKSTFCSQVEWRLRHSGLFLEALIQTLGSLEWNPSGSLFPDRAPAACAAWSENCGDVSWASHPCSWLLK